MRTEKEMFDLILNNAKSDERIRAVIMNGSRTNPNAPKDRFQDYDIVYVVDDIESFIINHSWIDIFGERIMLQMPENMRDPIGDGRFIYLMLFKDGNRIDLQLIPLEKHMEMIERDSLRILLIDKDGIIKPFPKSNDSDYHIKKPSEKYFTSCCNNFWWCLQNVSKGILRDELPYAMYMMNSIVREELHSMIDYYIGIKTNFSVSSGKCGKYYKNFLDSKHYDLYLRTFSDSNYENMWSSLFIMCELFREMATETADYFKYDYPYEDDKKVTEYLRKCKLNL